MGGKSCFTPPKYHDCPVYNMLSSSSEIPFAWSQLPVVQNEMHLFAIHLLCIGHLQDKTSRQCYSRWGKARKSEPCNNFHKRWMPPNYRYESGTGCCRFCCFKGLFFPCSFFDAMLPIIGALSGGGSQNEKSAARVSGETWWCEISIDSWSKGAYFYRQVIWRFFFFKSVLI